MQSRIHTVAWNKVCTDKANGGLSITKIGVRNEVLLSKWWWKFHAEKQRKWMQFLLNKYGRDFIYNVERQPKNMSIMFKDIWKCREE